MGINDYKLWWQSNCLWTPFAGELVGFLVQLVGHFDEQIAELQAWESDPAGHCLDSKCSYRNIWINITSSTPLRTVTDRSKLWPTWKKGSHVTTVWVFSNIDTFTVLCSHVTKFYNNSTTFQQNCTMMKIGSFNNHHICFMTATKMVVKSYKTHNIQP